jgi:hypothetical protein
MLQSTAVAPSYGTRDEGKGLFSAERPRPENRTLNGRVEQLRLIVCVFR